MEIDAVLCTQKCSHKSNQYRSLRFLQICLPLEKLLPAHHRTSSMPHPSEVYSSSLRNLALGEPLWEPEPSSNGQIKYGDVGYITEGRFFRLFTRCCSVAAPTVFSFSFAFALASCNASAAGRGLRRR